MTTSPLIPRLPQHGGQARPQVFPAAALPEPDSVASTPKGAVLTTPGAGDKLVTGDLSQYPGGQAGHAGTKRATGRGYGHP